MRHPYWVKTKFGFWVVTWSNGFPKGHPTGSVWPVDRMVGLSPRRPHGMSDRTVERLSRSVTRWAKVQDRILESRAWAKSTLLKIQSKVAILPLAGELLFPPGGRHRKIRIVYLTLVSQVLTKLIRWTGGSNG